MLEYAQAIAERLLQDLKKNGLNGIYFDDLHVAYLKYPDFADEMSEDEFDRWASNYCNFVALPDFTSVLWNVHSDNDYLSVEFDHQQFHKDLEAKIRDYFSGPIPWQINHYPSTGEFEVYRD